MQNLKNSAFSLTLLMFAVVLVLTISIRLSEPSLAKDVQWTQVFGADFDGPANSTPDPALWQDDTGHGYTCSGCPGNWGTGEIEAMSNSTANVYRDGNGHLVIKAIRDAKGNWTSGRIETKRTDFAAPAHGQLKITVSLQQPNVANAMGYWPTLWMVGSDFRGNYLNWPKVGGIGIMEDVNGHSNEFATLHCGSVMLGGPCNEATGLSSGPSACSGCQSTFHTYTVIIDRSASPEQIRWYLDDHNFFSVNAKQVPANVWSDAVDHSFLLVLELAIGGVLPAAYGGGPTPATTSDGSLQMDYVHVYTANQ